MTARVLRSLVALVLAVGAFGCGDSTEEESFDNLVDCVDDHSSLTEPQAITHCLVDFPDLHPDFADMQACVDFVTENGGYPDSRDAACADYFDQTGG